MVVTEKQSPLRNRWFPAETAQHSEDGEEEQALKSGPSKASSSATANSEAAVGRAATMAGYTDVCNAAVKTQ